MPEPAACGVDIGTTHIKAALVAADGSVLSVARADTPVSSDGFGACHDPEHIRRVAERVMRQAQLAAPGRPPVGAIGVTSVGEEGVPLSEAGELLYPSIAWYERRPSQAADAWWAAHGDEEMFAVTGLHKDLGFTIFKWLWLKQARPGVWRSCRRWLGIADYLIWRWTGQPGMSVSHASRTGVLNLDEFRWHQPWAAEVLADPEALPPLHQAGSLVGELRPGVIAGLAATPEVPVVATGLDHAVGGYAAGVTRPGQLLDSMGTAEGLIEPVAAGERDFSGGADFGAGIVPGTHVAIIGLASGAGVSGMVRALNTPKERLEWQAAALRPGADGLTYVPPRTRSPGGGAFFGHQPRHEAAHLYRAVLEGWSLAADHALAAIGDPARIKDVVCIGGGSTSPLWTRVKASIAGRPVRCLTTPEIVAVGAAMLAAGAEPGLTTARSAPVEPEPAWTAPYRELRATFRRLAAIVHPGGFP